MAVQVEADINPNKEFSAQESDAPVEKRAGWSRRWFFAFLTILILASGIMVLNGPQLVYSAASTLDGGTWSIQRPGWAVPIMNAELRLRKGLDWRVNKLEAQIWQIKKPEAIIPLLEIASGLVPRSNALLSALDRDVWFSFEPSLIVTPLRFIQGVIPEPNEIKDARKMQVWTFLRPDLSSQLLSLGVWVWPESPELHSALGENHLRKDLPALARSHFEQAVLADGEFAAARNNLGIVLTAQELYSEAIPHLKKASELNPGNPSIFVNLGNAYLGAGLSDLAAFAYQRAVDLDPGLTDAWALHGISSLNLGKLDQAKSSFSKSLAIMPDNTLSQQALGVIALRQESFEESFLFLEAASKAVPADAVTRLYLGQVLEKLDKPQDAIVEFEKALLLSDDPVLTGMSYAHLENLRRELSAGKNSNGGDPGGNP